MRNRTLALVAGVVVAVMALAGCADRSSAGDSGSMAAGKHGLPNAYSSGFNVPVINYPPYSIVDENGKATGFDADIANALGDYFGVPVKLVNSTFEESLLGVNRGSYTYAPAASVTADRKQTYDFVSYFQDRYRLVVKDTSSDIGSETTDMCGLSIAEVTGGYTLKYLEDFSKKCKAAGKPEITVKTFADQGAMQLAVKSGRVDAASLTLANGTYSIANSKGLKITGPEFAVTTEGLTLKKGSDLAQPLADAMNALIMNGSYAKILAKYNLASAAIKKAEVNPDTGE